MIFPGYRIAAECALWIARIGRPFWPARWRMPERLDANLAPPPGETGGKIWMHAASLGECKGLRALAETFPDALLRDHALLLTCNTNAGLAELRAFAATRPGRVWTRLAPLDHPRLARRFIERNGIRAAVLYELELWPHWIEAAWKAGVPVLWVSARFGARAQRRYAGGPLRRAGLRRVLERIAWTQAQTDEDAAILESLGCARCETGADLKGLRGLREESLAGNMEESTARDGIVFVSFHEDELPALETAIRAVVARDPAIPLWVFPRKAGDPDALEAFRRALAPHGFAPDATTRVLVEGFGRVEETLHRARIAVVGGSFADHGGHGLWEPLRARVHMVIGPWHAAQEFLARPLAARGLLRIARDANALPGELLDLCARDAARDETHRAACAAFIAGMRDRMQDAAKRVHLQLETHLHDLHRRDSTN